MAAKSQSVKTGEEAKPVFPIDMDSIHRVDEQLTNHAVSFIESTKGGKQPFFLYFATKGAHNDNYPHPDFLGKSLSKYPYKDAIVELDYRIGQIYAALERAGQLENTLLFITSDNGPFAEAFSDMGYTPFRGAKGSSYEGGVRVPGIAYSKGTIQPSLYGGKLFNLLIDTKEEHAMLPLKQSQSPVVLGILNKHLATFKAYPPPVPMQ